jgi:Protein of unknown function (DUF3179)
MPVPGMTHRLRGTAPHRRAVLAVILALLTAACLAWVAVPIVLIRPFSPETPRDIAVAFALRAWNRVVPPAVLLAAVVAAASLWTRLASRVARGAIVAALLLAGGATWLARQNHFEWMFAPIAHPGFVAADGAHGVEPEDLVLGVARHGEACAYPVRALAYHHVVNASVGGDALVATY